VAAVHDCQVIRMEVKNAEVQVVEYEKFLQSQVEGES
jgi:hypothetical protein